MKNLTENSLMFVHYKSWNDDINIENKYINHIRTEYEYEQHLKNR